MDDSKFLETVVAGLVNYPDKIQIDKVVDEMGVLLTLTVDPKDVGIVVGKEGQTAKSLRCILRIVGAKNKSRVNLRITDPRRDVSGLPEMPKDDNGINI
jgi:hypothetical protein